MAKKYLLYIHEEKFATEPKKSKLVNRLLVDYYSVDSKDLKRMNEPGRITPVKKVKEELLSIPDLTVASEASCKGTHYMSREDCGKKGCPWSWSK